MEDKKLSDEQILQMISDFEALKEEEKAARLLGKGVDKQVYDIPGQDMVMKIPNHTRKYDGNTSLQNDYLYSKQLNKHVPVETPILIKRPDSSDVLLQKKLRIINDPTIPSEEFYDKAYDLKDKESREFMIAEEKKRIKTLPGNIAVNKQFNNFSNAGLEGGDIGRNNIGLDSQSNPKSLDVSRFWFGDRDPEFEQKNNALHKMRETFGDKMDNLAKTRIYRSMAPMALKSGLATAGGMVSLASEAADSPEAGDAIGQDAFERELAERKRRDAAVNIATPAQKEALSSVYNNLDSGNTFDVRKDALRKLTGK